MYLVTPCSRSENLDRIKESIQFDKIEKWYIVYDNTKFEFSERYKSDPKIVEIECNDSNGISGNQFRNKALDVIISIHKGGFVYFLDDDNIVHPNFWNMKFDSNEALVYTFPQQLDASRVRTGDLPLPLHIDIAQYIIHTDLIGKKRFILDRYEADGMFVYEIIDTNVYNWKCFHNVIGCYYNFLKQT
jgi:hypothetical protein